MLIVFVLSFAASDCADLTFASNEPGYKATSVCKVFATFALLAVNSGSQYGHAQLNGRGTSLLLSRFKNLVIGNGRT